MSDQQRQAARQRTQETLERANETLAAPRPEGELWRLPEPEPTPSSPAPVQVQRKTVPVPYAQRPVTRRWVADLIVDVLGRVKGVERQTTTLRFIEAERRIAELEAKIEELKR